MVFKNEKQPEDFHSRIIRLQQEIILSGETLSPTRLLFQYTKEFSKSEKLKGLIVPKIIDIIKLPVKNGKYVVYTGGNIHGIYIHLEMIGD